MKKRSIFCVRLIWGYNMKRIGIAYEDGQIFQHFGKTPAFLIAEAEGKQIISQEIVSTNGEGHSALFNFLSGLGVQVVICGGIGQGARDALVEGGMEVIGGQMGSTEAALMFYLNGDLRDSGGGCCGHHHHHHGEDHACGEHGCR